MPYPVNSIADYIVLYTKELGNSVNNLKLQKILYYLEARFLIETEESLFDERIEKWRYGPVIPEVYYRFNHLGAEDIDQIPQTFDFMTLLNRDFILESSSQLESSSFSEAFSSNHKILIDDTIVKLNKLNPFSLVDETHKHNSWEKDEDRILAGERHIEYDRTEIREDFINNPDYALWLDN